MRDFRKFNIWNEGMDIVVSTYEFAERLPYEEKYGLKSQMCRSAVSIPSNIAEGCSRSGELDFKRFLEISLGSSFELETQYLICRKIGFIDDEILNIKLARFRNFQRQTNNFISKIKDAAKA